MTTTKDIRTGITDVGDAQLAYWERGAGQTVLLVHAGGFRDWFAPVFDEPALDGFRVVRMHRVGYGDSSTPDRHLTLADHARQCLQLLGHLDVDRAYWVGHSSSGSIGLQAALDQPTRLAGLVLLESAPAPAGPSSADLFQRVIGPTMAAVAAGDIPTATDIFLRGVAGENIQEVLAARLGEDAWGRLVQDQRFFFADEIRAAVEWQFTAEYAAMISLPTLLVTGAEGRHTTKAHAETGELLAGMLPEARSIELAGVGHAMPLEDPASVARLIAGFVRGLATDRSANKNQT
jgi:pimeloyl-ACP methyl ester carboxylesterase